MVGKKKQATKPVKKKSPAKKPATKPAKPTEKPIDPVAHFRYLADTPGFDVVARAIFSTATTTKTASQGVIVVEFPNGERLFAAPPSKKPGRYASWPAPFQALVAKHERLDFPTDDNRGWLLGSGNFENAYLDDTELEGRDDVYAPISTEQDWWIYHPIKRNARGDPALCFFSHEGASLEQVELGAGAQFLANMAEELGLRDVLPSEPSSATLAGSWWHEDNCLDDTERHRIELEGPPTAEQLASTRCLSVRELRSITDLPLRELTNLVSLSLYSEKDAKLESLAGIEGLANLQEDTELRPATGPVVWFEGTLLVAGDGWVQDFASGTKLEIPRGKVDAIALTLHPRDYLLRIEPSDGGPAIWKVLNYNVYDFGPPTGHLVDARGDTQVRLESAARTAWLYDRRQASWRAVSFEACYRIAPTWSDEVEDVGRP